MMLSKISTSGKNIKRRHLHKMSNFRNHLQLSNSLEPCLTNLLAILLLGAEIICTKKGSVSRKCSPCPESDPDCPRPPGMYGNYVNDDAIRNLFSAKTIHEFSAQSLLTFLA
ncbi:hypothetical protein K1719_000100 [Acacia pycnantha]|nr:hypothetical protein K1719_000100 [Acacia pycnantha]